MPNSPTRIKFVCTVNFSLQWPDFLMTVDTFSVTTLRSNQQPARGIVNTIGIVMKQDPYSGGSLVCRLCILI